MTNSMDVDFKPPNNSNYPPQKPTRLQSNLPDLPAPPLDSRNNELVNNTDLGVSVLSSSNNFSAPTSLSTNNPRPKPLSGEVSTEANPVASIQPQVTNTLASEIMTANIAQQFGTTEDTESLPDLPAPTAAVPVIGQFDEPMQKSVASVVSSSIKPKRSKTKLLTLVLGLIVLLSAGVSATYFGYIVPNKPENIWNKSWANIGAGYDHLISYSSNLQKSTKGFSLKGSYKAEGSQSGSGSIDILSYNADASLKVGMNLTKGPINFELRSIAVANSKFPDIYFKVSGIKSLGLISTPYDSLINSLDGKWISIDHSYTDQLASGSSPNPKLTAQDITDFQNAFSKVSKQWLFTSNPNHQVIQIKQKIGKETQDKRSVYHYKAQLNKQNLKVYIKALRDGLKDTKFAKAYFPTIAGISDTKITDSVDRLKNIPNLDVWADTHTKLIHKLRVSKDTSYFEIGQDYQGGNQFPYSLSLYDKSGKSVTTSRFSGTLDMKTNISNNQFSINSDTEKISGQLQVSPNNNQTKVDKPSPTTSIQDLLAGILGGSLSTDNLTSSSAVSTQSKDVNRKANLRSISNNLEVYYAINGFYPTLANLNDSTWLAANASGLDVSALKDPDGTSSKLSATPAAHIFAYAPTTSDGKACSNAAGKECTKYTLTATLSDSSKYNLSSLN